MKNRWFDNVASIRTSDTIWIIVDNLNMWLNFLNEELETVSRTKIVHRRDEHQSRIIMSEKSIVKFIFEVTMTA